jgi:hypothetical protein
VQPRSRECAEGAGGVVGQMTLNGRKTSSDLNAIGAFKTTGNSEQNVLNCHQTRNSKSETQASL